MTDTVTILRALAQRYPQSKITADTIHGYVEDLADMPVELLALAADMCKSEYDWFPTVHQLRDAAANLMKRAAKLPSAAEAWEEMLKAPPDGRRQWSEEIVGVWHIYTKPYQFSNTLLEKVARNMGWPDRFWTGNEAADRARFLQAYEAQIDKSTAEVRSLPAVREYVKLGGTNDAIKQLAKGMSK